MIECEVDEDAYLRSVSSEICMWCDSWRSYLRVRSHLLRRDVRRRRALDYAVDRVAHHGGGESKGNKFRRIPQQRREVHDAGPSTRIPARVTSNLMGV